MPDQTNEVKIIIRGQTIGLKEAVGDANAQLATLKAAAAGAGDATAKLEQASGRLSERVRDLSKGQLDAATRGLRDMGEATVPTARGLQDVAKGVEAIEQAYARAARGFDVAGGGGRFFGQAEMDRAIEGVEKFKRETGDLATIGSNLVSHLQMDMRHVIAIFDESQRGQRGAMTASITALARDSGALDAAIKGVGATATWFATTPMGQVTAAIAGIVASIAIGVRSLLSLQEEMRRVGGEALAMGRQPEEAIKGYERLRAVIAEQGSAAGEAIASAIERIPRLSEAAREAIARIAPAMLAAQFGGDEKQLERRLLGIFGSSAETTAFVEKNRLLGGEQLATFLGAAQDKQAAMLAQALAARYGPDQSQLKSAADIAAAAATGAAGGAMGGGTISGGPTRVLAMPTAAPLNIPSQAEFDAIEAARKAFTKEELIEQLQQQIAAIKAGMPYLPASMQAEMQNAIARLQAQIEKDWQLPRYQAGGIVPGNQLAQLHAGEMVLPADVSALLQSLVGGGNAGQPVAATDLKNAADKLEAASGQLNVSASQLDISTDAINGMVKGLESGLERALFDVHRSRYMGSIGQEALRIGLRDMLAGVFKDLQSSLASLLFGAGTSSLGAGFSNLIFGSGGLVFGPSGIAGALGLAGSSAGLLSAAFGGGGFLPWLGGLARGLLPAAPALAWIEKGGIVPSAAQGWVVPSFQEGGILSMLHKNEMVLPAHISNWVQNAAAGGQAGHTFNLNISAWDAKSVMNAGPSLVAALNAAMRNGSMLRVPT
jgi:hypothetical protein